jgi:hypothetical protein
LSHQFLSIACRPVLLEVPPAAFRAGIPHKSYYLQYLMNIKRFLYKPVVISPLITNMEQNLLKLIRDPWNRDIG